MDRTFQWGPVSHGIIEVRSWEFLRTRSSNLVEIAVPTKPTLEAAPARHTLPAQCFAPVVPFLNQRLAYAKPVTLDGGASIDTHTDLREPRDLPGHLLRLLTGAPFRG